MATPQEAIAELKLTMETEFVPFSQSRNKNETQPFLNWRVKILRRGREFIATDYMAGNGHCPAGKLNIRDPYGRRLTIAKECETGKPHKWHNNMATPWPVSKDFIQPKIEDVLYSLTMDADAIEYPTYEEWAGNLGYEADSRKGESIYRACLEIGLKLRAAIGEAGLTALREAFQDY